MLEARVITCPVRRNAQELYDMLWRPESFPRWASGLSSAALERDARGWKAIGPDGEIRITFTERNGLGVMDHWVELADGHVISVPMRIIPNGDGSLVMLTLFRQPGTSAEKFAADEAWVRRDFATLKALAEDS